MKYSSLKIAATVAAFAITTFVAFGDSPTITAVAKAAPVSSKQQAEKSSAAQRAQAVVAKSEFVMPRKVAEGRDPFFPNSSRPYVSETVAKPTGETSLPDVEFSLKGISGTVEQPLAIINTTTFTAGEENEIIFKTKRIKIRCVEINMTTGSVLIEYAGSRRMLKL